MNAVRRVALVRDVSAALERCQLTHVERTAIDVARARRQHHAYCDLLAALGCDVVRLPALDLSPDAVFVEDVALVFDEMAIATRPGAESRRGEVASVAQALARWRDVLPLDPPATLDGGDVLRLGRTLYVGRSSRSSADGIAALARRVAPFGYDVVPVPLHGCLHLKSAVTRVSDDTLLVQPAWVDPATFDGWHRIAVAEDEAHAANALAIGTAVVYPDAFPRTRALLDAHGLDVHTIDVSELQKAEGAVTCCSLVFDVSGWSADG
ncbi:dimethylarginine dimethylaminohydrolase family protein [Chiayiivirga flava]|uniref:Dimethylargininase n=1 Tax=Chiayiivirga flava TaxID=659595 RepID=A0A7W8G0L2_9GAMM|nr:dimethylargininase [Chiayiivirga flava]MBB5206765.1 dimethylargininase [Chiayiivirga flava]